MSGIRVGKLGVAALLVTLVAMLSGCAWQPGCPVEEKERPQATLEKPPAQQAADTGDLEGRVAELERQVAADQEAITNAQKTADKALKCCRKEFITIYSEEVYFAFNSFALDAETTAKLDRVAEKLKLDPDYIIEIAGHCDSVGNIEYNIVLGQKRADAVRTYFVDKHHILFSRVTIRSGGKTEPASPNDTEEGRAKNRRATISVLGYTKE